MAIKLVSDVHGAHEALASQLSPDDKLVMLGDYANLIDFETLDGIISDIISKQRLLQVLVQVAAGQLEEAEELVAEFTSPGGRYYSRAAELLRGSYRSLFDLIPCETHLLFGNNDFPEILRECVGGNARIYDGEVVTIETFQVGFVSGSPPDNIQLGMPGYMDRATYSAKVASLGQVDVLCSHVPPSGMGLEYDIVAAREEASSEALTAHIRTYQPMYAFCGHVHNPGRASAVSGSTRIRNLGHFRQHGKVVTLEDGSCFEDVLQEG